MTHTEKMMTETLDVLRQNMKPIEQERIYKIKVVTFHETVEVSATLEVVESIMKKFYRGEVINLGHKLPELEGDKIDQITIDKTDDFIYYKK